MSSSFIHPSLRSFRPTSPSTGPQYGARSRPRIQSIGMSAKHTSCAARKTGTLKIVSKIWCWNAPGTHQYGYPASSVYRNRNGPTTASGIHPQTSGMRTQSGLALGDHGMTTSMS